MNIRLIFAKTQAMRYSSHLDLMRTLERTFRRADLPLAYTQGFNPHPRLNLASALPLGFTSDGEIADLLLEVYVNPEQIQHALEQAAPPGIHILSVQEIAPNQPALQSILQSSAFMVTLLEPVADLEQNLEILLSTQSLVRTKRGKNYDLRPLIETINLDTAAPDGEQRILMQLAARQSATGRPDEVLEAMGISPFEARFHRTKLVFQEIEPAKPV